MPNPAMNDPALAVRALEGLLASAGMAGAARMTPGAVAFGTRFHAAEAAGAALAATGIAAAEIQARGTGHVAPVSVELRHAELSLISFALQRFLDPDKAPAARLAPEERTAVAGFHPTADGRTVYLHAGFPHNTRLLLDLLGVADEREQVRTAVARWTGQALKDAVAERGLCGAMVRTPEEWDASAAGRLLAARPVVDIVQLGDSAPEPLPAGDRPLSGIRVLDLTRVLAGPTCARTLAMYGADAMRIGAEHLPSVPAFVVDTGLGKRAAFLDLTRADDNARLNDLVGEADVFSQGYRTGALERHGFGVMDVVRRHPGIVYVSINCYGHEGAWRARPGWEQLAQTVTGMAHLHGLSRHGTAARPELQPAAVTDYTTGYLAAFGVLAALRRRAEHGGSYWVRVSLARTGMWVRSLGLRDGGFDPAPPAEEELERLRIDTDTAWGRLQHLAAPVAIDGVDVGWTRPPCPLGSCAPRW